MGISKSLGIALGFWLGMHGGLAGAEEPFPAHPIHIVVPNEPGGTTDVLIRALVPSMAKTLGQSIVVENRAGASATIGSSFVARSAPDGYTLLAGSSAISINSYVMHDLPFDTKTDLEAVSRIALTPYFLIVNAGVKANSVAELVALAKAKPGSLTYASSGTGTSPHLTGARFAAAAGIDLLHVPYKGTGPAMNDLLAGRVDMMFVGLPSTIGQIQAGRLRALAVASDSRFETVSDVPTMKEAGLGNFSATSWFGILAPKGTPDAIKTKLAQAISVAIQERDVKATLTKLGAVPLSETPAQAQEFFQSDLVFWESTVARMKDQLK